MNIEAVDRKADAAHRRVDELDKRLTRLEVSFQSTDRKLDEVAKDVKDLSRAFYKSGLMGGITGTGGSMLLFLAFQQFGG